MRIPLWFQICYAIWQFIRSAKLFKLAYGIPYHLFLYCVGKVQFWPFKKANCCLINVGDKFDFAVPESVASKLERSSGLITANFSRGTIGTFGSFNYILPESKLRLLAELAYHKPDVLTMSVDYITEGFCIVNYDNQKTLLEKKLSPSMFLTHEWRRVLLYPSQDSTLNQNFIRILSIIPLVFTSRRMPTVSSWFSIGLIIADFFLNAFFQALVSEIQRGLVFAFRGVIRRVRHRQKRYILSQFLTSISESMKICDTLAGNFYDVEAGSLALINNFADPSYCEPGDEKEFGESVLPEKPTDEIVSQAFKKVTGFCYDSDYSHYVEVETSSGKIFMGYSHDAVCVFPVNNSRKFHGIQMKNGNDGVKAMLSVMCFINSHKSNLVDISSDGYAHSVSLEYLVNNPEKLLSCKVVKIKKKITVAGSS